MKMKKFYLSTLIIVLSFFACTVVYGEDDERKWYQVELIIFSNNNSLEAITESWPEKPTVSNVVSLVDLVSNKAAPESEPEPKSETTNNSLPDGINRDAVLFTELGEQNSNPDIDDTQKPTVFVPLPFGIVDKSDYRLTVSAEKLQNSSKYDLLLHISWRQPAFNAKDKSAVYIYDGVNTVIDDMPVETIEELMSIESQIALEENIEGLELQIPENNRLETGLDINNNIEDNGPGTQQYFGTFKLTLSRFLHIDIDMIYRDIIDNGLSQSTDDLQSEMENEVQNNIGNNVALQASFFQEENFDENRISPQDFRLKTSRRVKPDEIHYFDHPKFGFITMVTRYTPPEPEEEEPTMRPFIP